MEFVREHFAQPQPEADTFVIKEHYSFQELLAIFAYLRSEEGCPWDVKQDHRTLTKHLLEEVYEVIKAVEDEDDSELCEELGDLLLQVVFHSEIARRDQRFTIADVIDSLARKLISRHSHVFGRDRADNAREALGTWQNNKDRQRQLYTLAAKLNSIDNNLPQTLRAAKLQQKAANAGFDWEASDHQGVFDKIAEEFSELKDAHRDFLAHATENEEIIVAGYNRDQAKDHLEEEAGDLLMIVINYLRRMDINPEIALKRANDKFLRRLSKLEELVIASGQRLKDLDVDTINTYYLEVKKNEIG